MKQKKNKKNDLIDEIVDTKKRNTQKINRYKKLKVFDEHGVEILADGSRVVDVDLKEPSLAFNQFAVKNSDFMNQELYDYVQTYARKTDNGQKLTVRICTDANDEEKQNIEKCFREQFLFGMKKSKEMLSLNLATGITMMLVGLILLAVSLVMDTLNVRDFYISAINIFGTFFIWTACDNLLVQNKSLRYKYLRDINLYESNIIFCDRHTK